ncbi:MAG: CDP-glycerol glycerophosphotransferase family protein [Clostridia bacterium]|nr:CDP-glycerol glycerophosphotransferase family protein [Clostridia bacterium]
MRKIIYGIFAFLFNLNRIFPVKENRIALVAPHKGGSHDSLWEIKDYLEKNGNYEVKYISTSDLSSPAKALKLFFAGSRYLATSKYLFFNDNFMPMASMNFSEKAKVIMLWHAEGAFKKFGLMTDLDPDIKRRQIKSGGKLSCVICTSKNIVPVYAEAFGVDESRVLPLGSPRTDYLLRNNGSEELRKEFDKKHPECAGKKLVLYAPTFRDNPEKDAEILSHINGGRFDSELGGDYALLVKLHPQVHSSPIPGNITDVANEDIAGLTLICDTLITDYSSVCMDFALLSKPCIFYAYDLEEYENERSFCFGYKDYVPGPVVYDFNSVIDEIKNPRSSGNAESFRKFNFDYIDCGNTGRVLKAVISASLQ